MSKLDWIFELWDWKKNFSEIIKENFSSQFPDLMERECLAAAAKKKSDTIDDNGDDDDGGGGGGCFDARIMPRNALALPIFKSNLKFVATREKIALFVK